MVRILITVIVAAIAGLALGRMQSSSFSNRFEERFAGSRVSMAETRGEITKEQLEQQQQTGGSPKLEVIGGTEYDFGTMRHGETMSREFIFRNIGTGPLNLDMGGSTCKCTVGDLDQSILQPGEQTVVKLTWTAQSIIADFGQSATVITTDPQNTEVRLRVRGQIVDSFVVEPGFIALDDVPASEGVTRVFHVFSYLEKSETLTDFLWTNENTAEFVKIDFKQVDVDPAKFPKHRQALRAYEVTLSLQPGLPIGPLNSRIQFSTDQGDDVGRLDVPVEAHVVSDISLFGGDSFNAKLSIVQLGNVQSSQGASVTVMLAIQGSQRDSIVPEIVSVKPAESLNVRIGEPRTGRRRTTFPIHFEVPMGAPEAYYPGNSKDSFGKVLVRTNHEIAREIPIYVRMVVTD